MLFERLNVKDELELFKLLDLELLVLTKGKKGALFVFKNSKRELSYIFKSPKIIVEALDTSGAGDAFFSSVVREYAYTQKIDESFVNRSFEIANSASRDILSKTGSRK